MFNIREVHSKKVVASFEGEGEAIDHVSTLRPGIWEIFKGRKYLCQVFSNPTKEKVDKFRDELIAKWGDEDFGGHRAKQARMA